ncbi:MAG: hypothetical protein JSR34_12825 [Proteobacteria bacterium]|nr:hypothetical protein [Pseudomonadota bacterium]
MRRRRHARIAVVLALALAGCATKVPRPYPPAGPVIAPATSPSSPPAPAIPSTPRCAPGTGVVVRLSADAQAAGSTMGGGVIGGVLANDSKSTSAHPATDGGRDIYVQMDDGRKLIVHQRDLTGIAVGTRVGVDASCRASVSR